MTIRDLVILLKERFGNNVVSNPSLNPNKTNEYKVNVKILCDNINDTKIKNWAAIHWIDKNAIKIQMFIEFIENINNKSTRGTYHIYMDFIHAYYNVPIEESIPQYNQLDSNIKDKIKPQRSEYLIAWWIIDKIRIDEFFNKLSQTIKDKYLVPTYQEPIRSTDSRFYDVLFKKLNLIIEIQEDSKSHDECMNDLTKESLCALRGYRIKYFKLQESSKRNLKYLEEFWNGIENIDDGEMCNVEKEFGLKQMLLQGLFSIINNNDRETINKQFIINNYIEYKKKKYCDLDKEINYYYNNKIHIKDKIYKKKIIFDKDLKDKLELIQDDNTNSDEVEYIKILENWYKLSNNIDSYLINPYDNDFKKIFMLKSDKFDKFINLCWIGGYCGIIHSNYYKSEFNFDNNNLRFSWNGLVRLLLQKDGIILQIHELLNFDNGQYSENTHYLLELMLSIERSYNKITKSIIIQGEARINLSNQLMDLIEKHIHYKTTIKYSNEVERLEKKNELLQKELDGYKKITKKSLKKFNTLLKYIEPKKKRY